MHIEEIFVKMGYVRHTQTCIGRKGNREWVFEVAKPTDSFSSMGNIHFVYIKGESKIWYGLNEFGKPPTLISPRPNVKEGEYYHFNEYGDDIMNRSLKAIDAEKIYSAMFDTSITLEI